MDKEKFEQLNISSEKIRQLEERLSYIHQHDHDFTAMGKIAEFAESLRAKYKDCSDYRYYHVLAGSDLLKECSKVDFPDPDSVENFIIELSQKIDKTPEK